VLYSNGIGAKEEYLKKNPKVVQAFVKASLRGWKDALSNPEDAAGRQLKYSKGLDRGSIVAELVSSKRSPSFRYPEERFGLVLPAKMKASVDFVVTNLDVKGARRNRKTSTRPLFARAPILP